jgi:hypothetical protein
MIHGLRPAICNLLIFGWGGKKMRAQFEGGCSMGSVMSESCEPVRLLGSCKDGAPDFSGRLPSDRDEAIAPMAIDSRSCPIEWCSWAAAKPPRSRASCSAVDVPYPRKPQVCTPRVSRMLLAAKFLGRRDWDRVRERSDESLSPRYADRREYVTPSVQPVTTVIARMKKPGRSPARAKLSIMAITLPHDGPVSRTKSEHQPVAFVE